MALARSIPFDGNQGGKVRVGVRAGTSAFHLRARARYIDDDHPRERVFEVAKLGAHGKTRPIGVFNGETGAFTFRGDMAASTFDPAAWPEWAEERPL